MFEMKSVVQRLESNGWIGMSQRLAAAIVLATQLCWQPQVQGQQCPGSQTFVGPLVALMQSTNTGSPGPGYVFIGTGCSAAPFGPTPPTNCFVQVNTLGPWFYADFLAFFSNSTANTTANGCNFVCPGGSCTVRGGDALPVELMEFSVGESADDEAIQREAPLISEPKRSSSR